MQDFQGITPNGDGLNDTWLIDGLQFYPYCKVEVFSRWGQKVWETNGWELPGWNAKSKVGGELPTADYYYIIDLNNGKPKYTGYVTIKK